MMTSHAYDVRALPVDGLLARLDEEEEIERERAEIFAEFLPEAERLARQYRHAVQQWSEERLSWRWCPLAGGQALATELIEMIHGDAGAELFIEGMQQAIADYRENGDGRMPRWQTA